MADDQDKTEKPSAHRLKQARDKGQAAKSTEMSSVVTLAVFCFAITSALAALAGTLVAVMRSSLAIAGASPAIGPGFARWLLTLWSPVWSALAPAIFALVISAVAINMLQTGPIFSFTPLKADPSRLNPVQGLKKIFSMRTAWDLARLLMKLAILGVVVTLLGKAMWPGLLASAAAPPSAIPSIMAAVFVRITKWLVFVMALIAVLDLIFSRREFIRKLRMSRRDMKDEHRSQEGDPAIRSKRRRLAREMLAKVQAIGKVAGSDVIITNPTHYAVALQYRTSRMIAPVVLAKGSGWIAARIRTLAARHGIPIVRSPALARSLFRQCGIDQAIPTEHFAEVGTIYRGVMKRPGSRVRS